MRNVRTNSDRIERVSSTRLNGRTKDPVSTSRIPAAEEIAPKVVSRILAAAVIEQLARERAGVSDHDTVEARDENLEETTDDLSAAEAAQPSVASATAECAGDQDLSVPAVVPLWKRLFDCTVIILAIPLWLPVMLFIMVGVKLSSPGPIFFKQERVGFGARRFKIFKLRTMKVNVETRVHESYFERLMRSDLPMTKLDANGDPRLIPCGRFLRAAGLDELPQLFNILAGDMSLVGPRPCTVHEFERYLPWQRERVNALPGMTGYWQVNGKNKTTFNEMIEMDIFYSKNMSLSLDFWILCKTLPAVIGQLIETRAVASWTRAHVAPGAVPQTSNH